MILTYDPFGVGSHLSVHLLKTCDAFGIGVGIFCLYPKQKPTLHKIILSV